MRLRRTASAVALWGAASVLAPCAQAAALRRQLHLRHDSASSTKVQRSSKSSGAGPRGCGESSGGCGTSLLSVSAAATSASDSTVARSSATSEAAASAALPAFRDAWKDLHAKYGNRTTEAFRANVNDEEDLAKIIVGIFTDPTEDADRREVLKSTWMSQKGKYA